MKRLTLVAVAFLAVIFNWGVARAENSEEQRLQKFWHDYYSALKSYYEALDQVDWVAYYKNHGQPIPMPCPPGGSPRLQFAPVFVTPRMEWAMPTNSRLTTNMTPPTWPADPVDGKGKQKKKRTQERKLNEPTTPPKGVLPAGDDAGAKGRPPAPFFVSPPVANDGSANKGPSSPPSSVPSPVDENTPIIRPGEETRIATGKVSYTLPFTLPSADKILEALPQGKARPDFTSIRCELESYRLGPARFYPLVGPAQLAEARFKCTVSWAKTSATVVVDHRQLILVESK